MNWYEIALGVVLIAAHRLLGFGQQAFLEGSQSIEAAVGNDGGRLDGAGHHRSALKYFFHPHASSFPVSLRVISSSVIYRAVV